jgi:hypothetical protein
LIHGLVDDAEVAAELLRVNAVPAGDANASKAASHLAKVLPSHAVATWERIEDDELANAERGVFLGGFVVVLLGIGPDDLEGEGGDDARLEGLPGSCRAQ